MLSFPSKKTKIPQAFADFLISKEICENPQDLRHLRANNNKQP